MTSSELAMQGGMATERTMAAGAASPPAPISTAPAALANPIGGLAPGKKPTTGRLVLQNVTKRFPGSDMLTLQDVTIQCEPGEIVIIVGPSGCGKTTILNLAAGMTRPDSGKVTVDGRSIRMPGPDRAMVFQEHGLFPWLNAAQNIEFGLKMARVPKSERKDRVAEALKMVHLSHAGKKLVHQLSGGMRQRVNIARALVMNPAVLLMDEPFAALDAQTRTLLHHQLQLLWCQTQKTILFVTHSVGEAVRLADRIIVLHSHPGKIRKEFRLQLPHPRQFDSAEINELAKAVRLEIEEEVNRVNALGTEDLRILEAAADLDSAANHMGSGI